MTAQEIFDTVVAHLRKQGVRSSDICHNAVAIREICKYRSADGFRCAIGCLISDEKYDPGMEEKGVRALLRCYTYAFPQGCTENVSLLVSLQAIHDVESVDRWESAFKSLAVNRLLEYRAP